MGGTITADGYSRVRGDDGDVQERITDALADLIIDLAGGEGREGRGDDRLSGRGDTGGDPLGDTGGLSIVVQRTSGPG